MEVQLSTDEIKANQQLLQEYEPAQEAFAILKKIRADLMPVLMNFGRRKMAGRHSLRANPSGR
jgi:hypothetical protein